MYTEEDLRNLSDFIKATAKEALKGESPDRDKHQELMTLVRQMEAISWNPLIFKSILEDYDVAYSLMNKPLDQVPLHINDSEHVAHVLIQWRLTNNI